HTCRWRPYRHRRGWCGAFNKCGSVRRVAWDFTEEGIMPHELLTGFPVIVEQAVVWGEMDAYRHVNNVVYFRYFENARLEYFRRLDWTALERETGIGPILATTQAKFRKALSYSDLIWFCANI